MIQQIYHFANGLGAIVRQYYSQDGIDLGVWDLTPIKFDRNIAPDCIQNCLDVYTPIWTTPIGDHMLGLMSKLDVENVLNQLATLPAIY